jgi:ABC-type sulfate transport system permease component
MSTGIILGLGLASIVMVFYIMLNFNMWIKTENNNMKKVIKFFHDPNMVAIIPVTLLYAYGAYVFVLEFI